MQKSRSREPRQGKRLAKVLGTFVPIWAIIILAGWIVIATLLPIQVDEDQIARDGATEEILDFMPAAGPSDTPPER